MAQTGLSEDTTLNPNEYPRFNSKFGWLILKKLKSLMSTWRSLKSLFVMFYHIQTRRKINKGMSSLYIEG